jgi:hypothetical protein
VSTASIFNAYSQPSAGFTVRTLTSAIALFDSILVCEHTVEMHTPYQVRHGGFPTCCPFVFQGRASEREEKGMAGKKKTGTAT